MYSLNTFFVVSYFETKGIKQKCKPFVYVAPKWVWGKRNNGRTTRKGPSFAFDILMLVSMENARADV